MGKFVTRVSPRWSDMDPFRHVNHAAIVTLLEDARAELFFVEGPRRGLHELAKGVVVVRITVEYKSPLVYTGEPVRVDSTITKVGFASFTLRQTLYRGPSDTDPVAAQAELLGATYDTVAQGPRRLTDAERDFLAEYQEEIGVG